MSFVPGVHFPATKLPSKELIPVFQAIYDGFLNDGMTDFICLRATARCPEPLKVELREFLAEALGYEGFARTLLSWVLSHSGEKAARALLNPDGTAPCGVTDAYGQCRLAWLEYLINTAGETK